MKLDWTGQSAPALGMAGLTTHNKIDCSSDARCMLGIESLACHRLLLYTHFSRQLQAPPCCLRRSSLCLQGTHTLFCLALGWDSGACLPSVPWRAAHHCSDSNIYSPCFHLQWCSQTVPKCGSFQSNVETGVLPAIASVLNAQELGENAVQALGEAIPGLLQASPAFPVLAGFLHTWGCAESPCQANIDYNKCCMADV